MYEERRDTVVGVYQGRRAAVDAAGMVGTAVIAARGRSGRDGGRGWVVELICGAQLTFVCSRTARGDEESRGRREREAGSVQERVTWTLVEPVSVRSEPGANRSRD